MPVRKVATKVVRKPAKKGGRKVRVRRIAAKRGAILRTPPGYRVVPGSKVLVPTSPVVEPSKLYRGITKAKDEIHGLIQEIIDTSTEDYVVHEIEFSRGTNWLIEGADIIYKWTPFTS